MDFVSKMLHALDGDLRKLAVLFTGCISHNNLVIHNIIQGTVNNGILSIFDIYDFLVSSCHSIHSYTSNFFQCSNSW